MRTIVNIFLALIVTATLASNASAIGTNGQIGAYFRSGNENVGALACGVVIHNRDVSEDTKRYVKQRDAERCVICGSTVKLEVDHIRGLQNGGSNETSNLATLCDDCHTIKTRMDNSLRRKRERLCKINQKTITRRPPKLTGRRVSKHL